MKRRFAIISLVVVMMLSLAIPVLAAPRDKQETLHYNDIVIQLNGQQITPKDVNGNIVEPFTINGTTYLPVRAVGEALGLDVDWNSETKTVLLMDETRNSALSYLHLQSIFEQINEIYNLLGTTQTVVYDSAFSKSLYDSNYETISGIISSNGTVENAVLAVRAVILVTRDEELAKTDTSFAEQLNLADSLLDSAIEALNSIRGMQSGVYRSYNGYTDGWDIVSRNNAKASELINGQIGVCKDAKNNATTSLVTCLKVKNTSTEDKTLTTTHQPVTSPTPTGQATEIVYVCNKNSKEFHYPWCSYLPDIQNRIYITGRSGCILLGYNPCGHCNP